MQVSGARTSTYYSRKMYEMLAKRAGKIKEIYTHVDCGFPHPCPFYGVNSELISFGQGDLLAHSFKQAKSFLKKLLTGQVGKSPYSHEEVRTVLSHLELTNSGNVQSVVDVYCTSTALHMDNGPPPSSWETEHRSVHHSIISRQSMMLATNMGQRKSIYASVPYRCNLVSLENRGKHYMYKRNG